MHRVFFEELDLLVEPVDVPLDGLHKRPRTLEAVLLRGSAPKQVDVFDRLALADKSVLVDGKDVLDRIVAMLVKLTHSVT